ncbi:hypothetical protein Syun_018109 [Stephania yunnanensis]|uniref:4-coumarate--CoA ligase n=1 Tax=Stephania yunnanensis TaxID=152371 RepID=A0AAP0IRN2_9MAGN
MISVASSPETISEKQQKPQLSDEETFIFKSKLPDIEIPTHLPLPAYCFERLPEVSNKPCLISASNGRTYTYAETHLLCHKTALAFSKLGLKRGDCLMILLQNCPEFVFSFMGASIIGAVTTAANPFCTPSEIAKQLSSSSAKLVITLSQYANKLKDSEFDFKIITIDDPFEHSLQFWPLLAELDETEHDTELERIEIDDPVALPYSSGTTGLPKGVILTHKSLISSVAQQVDGENPNLYLKTEDVVLCVLPLFHIYALNSVLLCSLRAGASLLLMQKFEMGTLLELIQRFRVSVAAVVPPIVMALAKNPTVEMFDLSSIRIVLSGAAPLGKDLEVALKNRVPQAVFGQGYGMTEAGPVLSMCPAFAKRPLPSKSGSCGTVVRNAELKIVDPETGSSLPHNQRGEICIRGPQIMKGYLNDPEATKNTIDVEGWLHTGDIGYVDEDGEVFIVDRVKELIKFKGFQVPPAELEALLISHPSITDAAVVPQKDPTAGEVPVAFVVRSNDIDLTEEAVKELIAKQVVFYKRLHKVFFVHSIPKSPSGKILRKDLRAKLASTTS